MPLSVRKSIPLTPVAAALSLHALERPVAAYRALVFRALVFRALVFRALVSLTLTIALSPAFTIGAPIASAQAGLKQDTLQVKKLDDNNKEVLRPIPTVLKSKSESAPAAKPLEKQKAAITTAGKSEPGKEAAGAAAKAEKTKPTTSPPAKAEATKPAAAVEKKNVARVKPTNRGMRFVPPPPPTTPTMLGDSSDFAFYNGMPIEMLSKDALKDRAKEISIQYKDACRELDDHSRQKDEKIQRAAEFVGLYKEGVVSRRELEASQKDAAEVNSDIDRLQFKAKELKGLLERINARLTQTVAKKRGHKLIN